MKFSQHHRPDAAANADDLLILVHDTRLLVGTGPDGNPRLPRRRELGPAWAAALQHAAPPCPTHETSAEPGKTPFSLGELDGQTCWAGTPDEALMATEPPAGLQWGELRPITPLLPPGLFQAIACARELLWWERRHRFCGCCGAPTKEAPTERARVCTSCATTTYPVIAPAVIVAITRGDELLLAHNRNFRPGLHSLIAGFVDPGETLEQCVRREAREEVGVDVGELRYITSQPWPYPSSLMLGFHARHLAGDIAVDGAEIEGAAWYRRDALPEIPGPGTVARQLIDLWLDGRL